MPWQLDHPMGSFFIRGAAETWSMFGKWWGSSDGSAPMIDDDRMIGSLMAIAYQNLRTMKIHIHINNNIYITYYTIRNLITYKLYNIYVLLYFDACKSMQRYVSLVTARTTLISPGVHLLSLWGPQHHERRVHLQLPGLHAWRPPLYVMIIINPY